MANLRDKNYVLEGERHAEKSKELEERKSSDDSLQVESTRKLPDFVSEAQYLRKRNLALPRNCFGEPRLHSYES